MNSSKIKDEIQVLMETCREQLEHINNTEGKIPQIELDMVMDNFRKIYEQLHLLNKINNKEISYSNQKEDEHIEEQTNERNTRAKAIKHNSDEVTASVADNLQEKQSKIAAQRDSVISHLESVNEKTRTTQKPGSLFDQDDIEEESMPSLNEKLNQIKDNSLADKLKQKTITDLKQAIGINEKFLFINELFEGSLNEYNNALNKINSFSNKDEADQYISGELKLRYKWKDESKAHSIFIELVERRFS